MPTCKKCSISFTSWVVIDGKPRNLSNRHYCLECSPFGSYNTKNLITGRRLPVPTHCSKCCIELNDENCYKRPQSSTFQPWCKNCFNKIVHERQKQTKRLCVEYKGGCCYFCKYDHCIQALEFHHLGSEQKETEISNMRGRSFERIKVELDKCLLVCCRCHREIHAGLIQVPAMSAAVE